MDNSSIGTLLFRHRIDTQACAKCRLSKSEAKFVQQHFEEIAKEFHFSTRDWQHAYDVQSQELRLPSEFAIAIKNSIYGDGQSNERTSVLKKLVV